MAPTLLVSCLLLAQSGGLESSVAILEKNPRYQFDSLNRLRSLREPSGAMRWVVRDVAGRAQAETTLNWLGSVQSARIHHNDGYRRIATSQASGPKRFVYGRSLDELLFQEQGSSQLAPVVSQLGSTMKLLNAAGGIADQFRFDAFGAPLTGDSTAFSHLFAGAIYDHKSKLYDLRHRHYDPAVGRFLSRDPLGMHADGFNLGNAYAYVGNNPLNRRDPLGLLTGDGNEDPGFWSVWWKYQKQAFVDVGKGLADSAKGTWEAAKFVATEEVPDLIIDAGIAVGAIDGIPYQSASVQTAQKYYADAGNSVLGAATNLGKDIAVGAATSVKDYGIAVWEGDSRKAAETLGYALQGLGAAKTMRAIRGAKTGKGSEGPATAKCAEKPVTFTSHPRNLEDGTKLSFRTTWTREGHRITKIYTDANGNLISEIEEPGGFNRAHLRRDQGPVSSLQQLLELERISANADNACGDILEWFDEMRKAGKPIELEFELQGETLVDRYLAEVDYLDQRRELGLLLADSEIQGSIDTFSKIFDEALEILRQHP